MTSRGRVLWILSGAVAAFLLIAALVLPRFLDVERFRGRIENALATATGWDVELGKMDFRIWRGLALTVEPASLRAPGGGSAIEVSTLAVKARLLPLLSGHLDVREISLGEPRILLVRKSVDEGWGLPSPDWGRGRMPEPRSEPGGEGFQISIGAVAIANGVLRLEDRSARQPVILEIVALDAFLDLATGEARTSGDFRDGGGQLVASGSFAEGVRVQLDGVRTEMLEPWLGPDLLRPGGRISGEIAVRLPEVTGRLTGDKVSLLSGEKTLDDLALEFDVARQRDLWRANRLQLKAGAARLDGSGVVSPDLDLRLELAPTPLEPSLELARALFPVPLVLSPPGSAEASIEIRQPAGRALAYEATGKIEAARFTPGGVLPAASDLRATFVLSPRGALTVHVLEGRVAEGLLRGVFRLDRIDPPGTMTFEGDVQQAQLGGLLQGLIENAPERIKGPAALEAHLRVNLAGQALGPQSLGGRMTLRADRISLPGWNVEAALREKIGLDSAQGPIERLQLEIGFDALPWSLTHFEMASGRVTAVGRGRYDPLAGKIDVDLIGQCDAELTAELIGRYPELKRLVTGDRLAVPFAVSGALMKPSIKVDLGKLLRFEKPKKEDIKKLLEGLLDRKGS